MTTDMPEATKARLVGAAIAGAGREVCGFVLRDWELLPMRNVAAGDSEFAMDDDELLTVYANRGNSLLGVYHSHPTGRETPSDVDAMYAPHGLRYWIITNHNVYEWDMSHDPPVAVC